MWRDLRYTLRSLGKSPGFTVPAGLTLALGVAVVTAAFGVLNWFFLRPLPGLVDAGRLAVVQVDDTVLAGSRRIAPVTPTQLADLTRDLSSVVGLASFGGGDLTVGTGDTAFVTRGEFVTSRYFSLLGTRPVVGRFLVDQDDVPGGPAFVAVIGYDVWTTLFHQDPAVVGKWLRVATRSIGQARSATLLSRAGHRAPGPTGAGAAPP